LLIIALGLHRNCNTSKHKRNSISTSRHNMPQIIAKQPLNRVPGYPFQYLSRYPCFKIPENPSTERRRTTPRIVTVASYLVPGASQFGRPARWVPGGAACCRAFGLTVALFAVRVLSPATAVFGQTDRQSTFVETGDQRTTCL